MKGWQQGNIRSRYQMGICGIILMMILLAGCSQTGSGSATATENNGQPTTQVSTTGEASGTHEYIDYKGNMMQIPVHPQRIISIGGDVGDLLALGVEPIGASLQVIKDQVVYKDRLQGIADVGEPVDPEKVAALAPDLILVDGSGLGDLLWLGVEPVGASLEIVGAQVIYSERIKHIADVGTYGDPDKIAALRPDLIIHEYRDRELSRQLSSIAPVYLTYRHDPAHVRLRQIAGLTGKKREAEQWIRQHRQQSRHQWKQLKQQHGLSSSDHLLTGLVLIQIQHQLYVMGAHGVALTLYQPFALRPPQAVSNMIVEGIPYQLVQPEQLEQYRSDWVVLLIEQNEAERQQAMELIESTAWREVQKRHPFQIYLVDSSLNFDDVLTREVLLKELPTLFSPTVSITSGFVQE